ncbi:hypothetical protein WKI68_42175 [Streptomyces sp. MS1.HAVA.3]|uniref:Uncharacterized protein n=1 Tax=Streptomyces caledonius TaxID=3134107 RepID=A0ABU8UDS9_9ACTN
MSTKGHVHHPVLRASPRAAVAGSTASSGGAASRGVKAAPVDFLMELKNRFPSCD